MRGEAMSKDYSFSHALEALKGAEGGPEAASQVRKPKKPKKDCGAKEHKLYQIEKECDEAVDAVREAAREARKARDDYMALRHDPNAAPIKHRQWVEAHKRWEQADKYRLKLEKKVQEARDAVWQCHESNFAAEH